jgi:hypothetical protein
MILVDASSFSFFLSLRLTTVPGLDALSALVRFFVLDIESSVLDETGIFCSSTSFSTSTMTSPSLSDSILYCNQTKKQQEEESNRMERRSPKNDPELVIESFPSKIASLVTFDTKSHSWRRHGKPGQICEQSFS